MAEKEVAPPRENWPEHLTDLSDRDLTKLAQDYRWLDEQSHAEIQPEFHRRREAIIAECQRRGLSKVAAALRPAEK